MGFRPNPVARVAEAARRAGKLRIRGGSGLGDALYVRPIAEHYARAGALVQVLSDWPDVFLGAGVEVAPFAKQNVDVVAHYAPYKRVPGSTQWEDVCRCAKLGAPLPLRIDWTIRNTALVARLKRQAGKRPLVLVHSGREPMGRRDRFGIELLPQREAFEAALAACGDCCLVQVGRAAQLYPLTPESNLNGNTTVADLIDVAWACDAWVAQCSFAVPLAEAFGKPLLAIWSAAGLASKQRYISTITPEKVLSAPSSHYVVDDWPIERIAATARAFREALNEPGSGDVKQTQAGVGAAG